MRKSPILCRSSCAYSKPRAAKYHFRLTRAQQARSRMSQSMQPSSVMDSSDFSYVSSTE